MKWQTLETLQLISVDLVTYCVNSWLFSSIRLWYENSNVYYVCVLWIFQQIQAWIQRSVSQNREKFFSFVFNSRWELMSAERNSLVENFHYIVIFSVLLNVQKHATNSNWNWKFLSPSTINIEFPTCMWFFPSCNWKSIETAIFILSKPTI